MPTGCKIEIILCENSSIITIYQIMSSTSSNKPIYFNDGTIPFQCPFTIKFTDTAHTKWTNVFEQYWFIHTIDVFYQKSEELRKFVETANYCCLNITNNVHETGKGNHFNGTFSKRQGTEFENSPEFHFYTNSQTTAITHVSFCTTFKK